jgi:hypothetical protein
MMGIESIRGWSIYLALFMASCVVFERVWATINLQSYQNTYNPQAVAIILISTWILSLLMFILSFCLRYYRVTIFIIFLMSLFNGIVSLNLKKGRKHPRNAHIKLSFRVVSQKCWLIKFRALYISISRSFSVLL